MIIFEIFKMFGVQVHDGFRDYYEGMFISKYKLPIDKRENLISYVSSAGNLHDGRPIGRMANMSPYGKSLNEYHEFDDQKNDPISCICYTVGTSISEFYMTVGGVTLYRNYSTIYGKINEYNTRTKCKFGNIRHQFDNVLPYVIVITGEYERRINEDGSVDHEQVVYRLNGTTVRSRR